ncbi:MAG: response regulator [Xanthomonadales bacterium]|nr:response regulator [Xanthomonadales bacterium]
MAKVTILIAEDDPEILALTSLNLSSEGYQTLEAANGREALELYNQHRQEIRLVLLDLVMPVMGGQEVAETIRRSDSDTKILFVSGFVPAGSGSDLKEPILRKPYRASMLLDSVAELLGD